MFPQIHIFNACTFLLLLFFVFIPSLCVSIGNNATKTVYEALVQKCPQLEHTELQENLKDIFSTKCVNWAAINTTNTISSESKTNTQCLILYESLLSFCTKFGDDIVTFKGDLLPTAALVSTYTADTICFGNRTLSSSLTKTEHNISNILLPVSPTSCFRICCDFDQNKPFVVNVICQFSYYFATFEVDRFLNAHKLLPKQDKDPNPVNDPIAAEQKPLIHAVAQPADIVDNGQKVVNIVAAQESSKEKSLQEPSKDTQNKKVDLIGDHAPVLSSEKNLNPVQYKKESDAQVDAPKLPQAPGDGSGLPKNSSGAPGMDMEGDSAMNKPPAGGEPMPPSVNNIDPKPVPDAVKEQINKPEKPPADGYENPAEGNEERGQGDGAGAEGYGEDEEEAEQEGANVKPEPVMPVEIEQMMPIKKVKPSTVEDEAISNYNIPEEDMDGDSYFFSYFTVIMCLFIVGYVGYHNRQKILALLLEGKRGKRAGRQGRRPNSANYHKLDSNLEEAISSSCTKNASNVIY